ncbi:MAG: 1-deoxy-D-xylulose-5-phosphate synthase, partial [Clostridia bacterium]|nr:1-deoxy-D-xylulose-5-phosphate synthase [Clostridia bacterium]
PNPAESRYDKFIGGHAGNSLAAACGYARARKLDGKNHDIISVLGDGVLINGLTAESLNNISDSGKQIIIINDNDFSISPSVGSIAEYLSKLKNYCLSDGVICENSPFAIYDIDYIGVVDGHNIGELITALKMAKAHGKSVIIHTKTVKGKGLCEAENNPSKYHAVGNGKGISFADILGNKLVELAQKDSKIVAVTAAMGMGTGLDIFGSHYPQRFFDVGIAEGHAVTMSAALARAGYKPYVAIYSTFLQRAYDEIINDVCLSSLPVTFCIDRSGIVGEDGETHHGVFDLNYLLSIPNLTVASPSSLKELSNMLEWSTTYQKPLAIRYPRGMAVSEYIEEYKTFPQWNYLVNNNVDNIILATGANMVAEAKTAIKYLDDKGIKSDLVNARFNKPLDKLILDSIRGKRIFILEDCQATGGFAECVRSYYGDKKLYTKAIGDRFVKHGDISSLLKELELDAASVAEWVIEALNET